LISGRSSSGEKKLLLGKWGDEKKRLTATNKQANIFLYKERIRGLSGEGGADFEPRRRRKQKKPTFEGKGEFLTCPFVKKKEKKTAISCLGNAEGRKDATCRTLKRAKLAGCARRQRKKERGKDFYDKLGGCRKDETIAFMMYIRVDHFRDGGGKKVLLLKNSNK